MDHCNVKTLPLTEDSIYFEGEGTPFPGSAVGGSPHILIEQQLLEKQTTFGQESFNSDYENAFPEGGGDIPPSQL